MANESVEIQIARLEERFKTILDYMKDNKGSQDLFKEWMTQTNETLIKIDNRIENVEDNLAKASPTIDEFLIIKHKVVGAGLMGKWLWLGLGGILGALMTMRESIFAWLAK